MSNESTTRISDTDSAMKTWLDHHVFSLFSSFGRLWRKPWSTGLTIGVMSIALCLPLGLWLVLNNLERLTERVQETREITLFLKQDVTKDTIADVEKKLRALASVNELQIKTPEQGIVLLEQKNQIDLSSFTAESNPLPFAVIVQPKAGFEQQLAEELKTIAEVELVQQDALWVQRLDAWLTFGRYVIAVLGLLLAIAALLIVGNTVRTDIQTRKDELQILQLLGASTAFIRRPFLYLGVWYGLLSGVVALILIAVMRVSLTEPLVQLTTTYNSDFSLNGFSPAQHVIIVAGAALLGWLGAWMVTTHYLRQIRVS